MKVGKSTLITGLMKAVAGGEDFIGYKTTQAGVLYLAVEEHPRDVTHRFEEQGAAEVAPRIHVHSGYTVPTPALYQQMMDYVRANAIGLVVVDTLSKWAQPVIEDENDNSQVLKACVPFLHLARETGAAVLMIHHTSKFDQEGGRGIRGASSLFGIVDQALMLKQLPNAAPESRKRLIEAFGRYAETPSQVVIELGEDLSYRRIAATDDGGLSAAYVARVIEVAEAVGRPVTSRELAELTNMTLRAVQRYAAKAGLRRTGAGTNGDPYRWEVAPVAVRGLLPAFGETA